MKGGDGSSTRFGLPDTVGKDLNVDRSSSRALLLRAHFPLSQRLVSPGYDDHRSFPYPHNFNWKTHVISVFRLSGLSLGRPELARFNRDCVIFHKPHLQSKSLMPVINQTLSLTCCKKVYYLRVDDASA